ncbi:MAG: hypothetical protein H7211_17555 [Aquabacterium sp.]|nr:hypothetical protein [Ferruginibacter sp.]
MREGLQWKAHSHEVRVARTWNGKPDPPSGGARPKQANAITFLKMHWACLTTSATSLPHLHFLR